MKIVNGYRSMRKRVYCMMICFVLMTAGATAASAMGFWASIWYALTHKSTEPPVAKPVGDNDDGKAPSF